MTKSVLFFYTHKRTATTVDIDKQSLEAFGINVIQLTTLGSIIHLITDKEINIDEFKNRFNPYIIENIILTNEEILKINLLVGKENHNE